MATTLEMIDDLHKIAVYMDDEQLTQALTFVAKVILNPDIPQDVLSVELSRMQAIAMKLSLMAAWHTNVDKTDRAKKNFYYTASEQLNLLCQSLKYSVRST